MLPRHALTTSVKNVFTFFLNWSTVFRMLQYG